MKFQKILMTGCRDMNKKHPQDFFSKSGSVTFVPLWCPKFIQKTTKTKERSPRYLKTDGRTHRLGQLLRTPSCKPGVQKKSPT